MTNTYWKKTRQNRGALLSAREAGSNTCYVFLQSVVIRYSFRQNKINIFAASNQDANDCSLQNMIWLKEQISYLWMEHKNWRPRFRFAFKTYMFIHNID